MSPKMFGMPFYPGFSKVIATLLPGVRTFSIMAIVLEIFDRVRTKLKGFLEQKFAQFY